MTDATGLSPADTLGVMDALFRFGQGVDRDDMALLASAFSEDAVVDFGPCGRKLGLDFPVLSGGEMIVRFLGASAGTQTTTHVITNGRVHRDGNAAWLRTLVEATHLPRADHSRRFQMMNWYDVELVKQAQLWRIVRLVIDNAWYAGDPQVLLGR